MQGRLRLGVGKLVLWAAVVAWGAIDWREGEPPLKVA